MKQKCRIIAAFFAFAILAGVSDLSAEEKTKEFHEAWTINSVETLKIINKFGEVKIYNNRSDSVTIDVVITVEAPNENKADELLEEINIEFGKSAKTIKAETIITKDFKSRQKFSIDYEVNIPTDKNLDIVNKYGNTIVGELNANGDFDIKYGNFTAGQLNAAEVGKMNLNMEYGKADVSSGNDINVTVKYSTLNFGELDDLIMESKYAVVNIQKANSVNSDSKYDTFNFDEVNSFEANTKYSHIKIGRLIKSLKVDAGYGGIIVDQVDSEFDFIDVTNSYGQIAINLNDASYLIDAECEYCGISYPQDNFEGNKISESQTKRVKGKVGTSNGGSVMLRSKYGNIKLKD